MMGEKLARQLAGMIDHSLLRPALTDREIDEGMETAIRLGAAAICVKPAWMARCAERTGGSATAPTTVIGFPHGANRVEIKLREARDALDDGATELDCVVNFGKALSLDWGYVAEEIAALTSTAHAGGARIKIIFENAYLRDSHKTELCRLCVKAGADWVKTSTGFAPGGATVSDLRLMAAHVAPPVQIKAAGGIRTARAVVLARDLGVTRIGATATEAIHREALEAPEEWLNPQPVLESFEAANH